MLLNDVVETLLGLGKPALGERRVSKAQDQLREKIFGRKEALNAVTFLAVGIEDENCRRPVRAETVAELFEGIALFSSVHADWDEVLFDEFRDAGVGIHLGIQPSTTASHRRSAEVQQHVTLLHPRMLQRALEIVFPCDRSTLDRHLLTSGFPSPCDTLSFHGSHFIESRPRQRARLSRCRRLRYHWPGRSVTARPLSSVGSIDFAPPCDSPSRSASRFAYA
jgi:hypothetical protein